MGTRLTGGILFSATLLSMSGCGGEGEGSAGPTPTRIELKLLSRYATGTFGSGASEIPAYDPGSVRVFVVNGAAAAVDVISIANPSAPAKVGSISVASLGLSVNSVAVRDGIVALAIEANPRTSPGTVAFYRAADLTRLSSVTVGAVPDMLTFTPDGRHVLVANEGEPNDEYTIDPEGSISIIDVSTVTSPLVRTAGFTTFNSVVGEIRAAGIRIFGPNASVAQDVEPEYIAVSADSTTAWVTLQENNALAVVDIPGARVTELLPLGYKSHAVAANGLDPSDRDDVNGIRPMPVLGMYQPDAIAAYTSGGSTFLIMANEGDSRGWTGFNEEVRVGALALSPALAADPLCGRLCKDTAALGRLTVTKTLGLNPATGEYDRLYVFGGRSFSIRDTAGRLVYDSGSEIEQRTLATAGVVFNVGHDNNTRDDRSDNKGPEPEGVVVGQLGDKTYAFIGLERTGGIMAYDITNASSPLFQWYEPSRDFSKPVKEAGDLGPEGLVFVPAYSSPNNTPLLIVGNEISGTTSIFEVVRVF